MNLRNTTAFLCPTLMPLGTGMFGNRQQLRQARSAASQPPSYLSNNRGQRRPMARAAPPGFVIRPARRDDLSAMCDVTARAFAEDDEDLRKMTRRLPAPFARALFRSQIAFSAFEIGLQLRERLPLQLHANAESDEGSSSEQGTIRRGKRRQAHAVLVAVDEESSEVAGCVEVGLINIVQARDAPISATARLWAETAQATQKEAVDGDILGDDLEQERQERNMGGTSSHGIKGNSSFHSSSSKCSDRSDMCNDQVGTEVGDEQDGSEGRAPYLGNLAVAPEYRRRGVGRALVTAAQDKAVRLWRDGRIWLHVEADNGRAVRLYRRLGFTCEGSEPSWCRAVGRRPRLLLRAGDNTMRPSIGQADDATLHAWSADAKSLKMTLNPIEYVRWCFYDLGRTRRGASGGDGKR